MSNMAKVAAVLAVWGVLVGIITSVTATTVVMLYYPHPFWTGVALWINYFIIKQLDKTTDKILDQIRKSAS